MSAPSQDDQAGSTAPAQTKTRKNVLTRFFKRLLFSCIIVALLSAAALYSYYQNSTTAPRQFNNQVFKIKTGQSFSAFARNLVELGVIKEPFSFQMLAHQKDLAGQLHAGQYQLEDGLNLQEILNKVTSGKGQISHSLQFVQGSTFRQLLAYLKSQGKLKQTLGQLSGRALMRKLFDKDVDPEGQFYPDKYLYQADDTDVSILRRAHDLMQKKLDAIWSERAADQVHKTSYEALIMASIIEKETAQPSERPLISGVFSNRLNIGMRLQTDPTVIYGIGPSYDGNITRKHLKTDTPYNTYTRYGLPRGPICLPGEAAIWAAVNPESTKALYFVAKGDGQGSHYFSKTLQEHNKAVRKYQINRKKS